MKEPDTPPRVVGVYLDLTNGTTLADMRVSVIVATEAGRLIMRPADGGPVSLILPECVDDLLARMGALHCERQKIA